MKLKQPGKLLIVFLISLNLFLLSACAIGDNAGESEKETGIAKEQATEGVKESEGGGSGPQYDVVKIKDSDWTVCAGLSKSRPDQNIESVDSLELKNSADETTAVLIRMPLPAGITSDELMSAELRLKRKGGDEPMLRASAVTNVWDRLEVTWNELEGVIASDNSSSVSEREDDEWYSIDVTAIVRRWLRGDSGQYGFMVEETQAGVKTSFFSSYDSMENCPELILTGRTTDVQVNRYAYEEQEEGNCLSFALRDKSPILETDLQISPVRLQEIYQGEGVDAASVYVEELALNYIHEHAEALQISQIRKLSAFDDEIDPEREYRIAARIGIRDNHNGTNSFDYHWQTQLPDGSWAEKFGLSKSRIVPGSNRTLDPCKYPWDQNEMWGFDKWTAFYNSKAAYYAVTKKTAGYTTHRPVENGAD